MEDTASEYASSLHDLTTNSKPLISMLTMLADEYRPCATSIVKVIEDYLKQSCAKIKLPTLYLIDSIIKNVGEPYKKLFTENIIKIFLDVFQEITQKLEVDTIGKNSASVKDIVESVDQKTTDSSKMRHTRTAPESQAIPLDREAGENMRVVDSSVNCTEQRRTDPRLKRRHNQQQQPQQLFEHQLLQPDFAMAEKAKSSDLTGSKDGSSCTASKTGDKKFPSSKRSRGHDKEQQRVNGKRQAGDSHGDTSNSGSATKGRTSSSKSNKEKSSSSLIDDRKSSRSGSSASSNKKSPKSSTSRMATGSEKSTANHQVISGRSPNKSPSASHVVRTGDSSSTVDASVSLSSAPSLADKEAAAILTGDIDLRILEPINKKLKTERSSTPESPVPSALDLFPKGDIDLRIRPAGGISDPGQPLVVPSANAVLSAPQTDQNATEQASLKCGAKKKDEEDDEEDELDKELQWAKLKGRPLRNLTAGTSQERNTRRELVVNDERGPALAKGASSSTAPSDPLCSLSLRGTNVRSGASEPVTGPLRGSANSMPLPQGGARMPLTALPIVDVTPKQNAIPDLFPPGRSRTHIKISDPAPDSGQIRLDGRMREVRFVDGVAIAVMDEAPPNFVRARQIMFKGGSSKKILINEHHQIMAAFDGREHEFTLNGNRHRIRFGAPLRELYVDGIPYSCQFNGVPVYIRSREDVFSVTLHPPCPSVNDKMEAPKDLLAKLGLLPLPPEGSAISPGGCVIGVLPPGSQVPIASMAAPLGGAPAHLVGGPSTGGWVRYQEDNRMAATSHLGPPGPPGPHPPPGIYPPPGIPHNMPPLPPPTGFGPGHHGPPAMFGPPPPSTMGGPMPGPPIGPSPYGPMGPPAMMPYGQPHPGMHAPPHMLGPAGGMMRQPIGPPIGPHRPQERPIPVPPGVVAPITTPVTIATAPAAVATPQVNVSDLLNQLVTAGIIGGSTTTAISSNAPGSMDSADKKPTGSILNPTAIKEDIPKLSFKQSDQLKQRYSGVISALHDGLQCATCGQRFKQADKNSDKYAQHLDWHFRMARREREGLKKASSRKWFYDIPDWVQFEEVEDIEDRARSYFELQEAQHDSTSQDSQVASVQEIPSVPAKAIDQGENICVLCREAFELFFCEESEEWRLKNAVLSDGQVIHPACHEDFLRPARKLSPGIKAELDDGNVAPKQEKIDEQNEKMDTQEHPQEGIDEGSQPLPGLDFAPSVEELLPITVKKEPSEVQNTMDQHMKTVKPDLPEETKTPGEDDETMDEDLNDTVRAAEQSVVVEELGEFGVDNLAPIAEDDVHKDETTRQDSSVGADAFSEETDKQEPYEGQEQKNDDVKLGSPQSQSDQPVTDHYTASKLKILKGSGGFVLKVKQETVTNGGDGKGASEQKSSQDSGVALDEPEDEANQDQQDEDEEWVPPQPDPVFKNLPTVRRGVEESGLCSIM
ncbi:hypothetical protein BIW11_05677 [Tropilaelaps mercedesae]|uniref:CID domain-containing protein n=1 Tax=Tropilaelaps mercedesae TaxID=418985 RepID=A0A1V9Y1B8_9ACAR|nr:hypothetical protein BIW11_05677 [Tropilaelaps mercedesae]